MAGGADEGNADSTVDVVGNGAVGLRLLLCEGLRQALEDLFGRGSLRLPAQDAMK